MRNGKYELKSKHEKKKRTYKKSYRVSNQKGYVSVYEPGHPLSQASKGYVYEHRFVLFNKHGYSLTECELCGAEWNWHRIYHSHVDHIDGVVTHNEDTNLRPLCNSCNVKSENRHYNT